MRFLQTPVQAYTPSKCLGILMGQAGSQFTSACRDSGSGTVQTSHARSQIACDLFDFNRNLALMTFKRHYFWISPIVTDYRGCHSTFLPVRQINLKSMYSRNLEPNYLV